MRARMYRIQIIIIIIIIIISTRGNVLRPNAYRKMIFRKNEKNISARNSYTFRIRTFVFSIRMGEGFVFRDDKPRNRPIRFMIFVAYVDDDDDELSRECTSHKLYDLCCTIIIFGTRSWWFLRGRALRFSCAPGVRARRGRLRWRRFNRPVDLRGTPAAAPLLSTRRRRHSVKSRSAPRHAVFIRSHHGIHRNRSIYVRSPYGSNVSAVVSF